MDDRSGEMGPQAAAEQAVAALGCGFDITCDVKFTSVKPVGRIVEICGNNSTAVHDLLVPGGVVLPGIPAAVRCDKGESTRFRSGVLSFNQMSEQFNQEISLSGIIPSGIFNAMFDFRGLWKREASMTKSLSFDGRFITLYTIEMERCNIQLPEEVKQDVPSSWDPAALAEFIEKYGTHIVVGVKMGGKDVIYVKQQQDSSLDHAGVQMLLKGLADESFSDAFKGRIPRKQKNNRFVDAEHITASLRHTMSSVVSQLKKDDIVTVHVRRGGINSKQRHSEWLSTVPNAPNVISMSFVPIASLLDGVRGCGLLTHAVNLYLRYKPQMEDLRYFLEFQVSHQWAPLFGEIPIGPKKNRQILPALQFTFLGPKLYVNTAKVNSSNRPVTGIRLFLEGKKNNCLGVHLQHLSEIPSNFQLSDETECSSKNTCSNQHAYYEPVKRALLSHVCTEEVQYNGAQIDDSASIVTKAWLEVRGIGAKRVLFLRLGFSNVASMKIRRSEWDGPRSISKKSGPISGLFSGRFSSVQSKVPNPNIEVNSAVYPGKPPVPIRVPKLSKFVDTTELIRGPDDFPGHWVVTGAKLCVEGGKIFLKIKYSLLMEMSENDL